MGDGEAHRQRGGARDGAMAWAHLLPSDTDGVFIRSHISAPRKLCAATAASSLNSVEILVTLALRVLPSLATPPNSAATLSSDLDGNSLASDLDKRWALSAKPSIACSPSLIAASTLRRQGARRREV